MRAMACDPGTLSRFAPGMPRRSMYDFRNKAASKQFDTGVRQRLRPIIDLPQGE
jgi:hypothetical protein